MAQHNNEHLTITQLSAYLDQEMAPDELELCAAHVQTCQPCQAALADLRLTSTLLNGMPQVQVPRSFTLPTNFIVLPTTPTREERPARRPDRRQHIVKRTARALSTIAAVIGLLFILVGAFSTLSHQSYNATSGSAPNTAQHAANRGPTTPQQTGVPPNTQSPHSTTSIGSSAPTQTPKPQPTANGDQRLAPNGDANTPQPTLPPVFDPGQPEGRLSIGSALLLFGILGLLMTRRRQRERV